MPALPRIEGPASLTSPLLRGALLGFILLCFALTNLPWTLDDYDQAKQAYTSFEMVRQGHWLYQHTPNEGVATKPPLVGWISAGIFGLSRWWDGAWRLPSFLSALFLLGLIFRESSRAYGGLAGTLALSAFGLNLLSPRLATLVRTDMPLALATFLVGLQIWRKIRSGRAWDTRDRVIGAALLALALWIKGPIVYAFVLPGLVVYQLLRRREAAPSAWCGWWPWLLSLALFLAWAIGGIVRQEGFYESVVLKEFAGRFTETVHRPQPIYFYLPHLLHKLAPWSFLLVAGALLFRRARVRMEPATRWLVCWSMGGLVLMSLIPSKRVDRIFPVIPPLCLLLGAQIAAAGESLRVRRWLAGSLLFAVVFTGGYVTWKIGSAQHRNAAALVRFAGAARLAAEQNHWRYGVVGGREEGLLLYLRRDHFLSPNEAARQWQAGQLDALILPLQAPRPALPGGEERLVSEKSRALPHYALIVRAEEKPPRQGGMSR